MSVRVQIRPHTSIHRHEGTHTHTFAGLLPVVVIASWAVATLRLSRRVHGALAFEVAAAVIMFARVLATVCRARVPACTRVHV